MVGEVKEIVVLGKTLGGKTLQWVRQGRMARICFKEGGELPKDLQGGWTDQKNALAAVNSYLAKQRVAAEELEAEKEEAKTKKPTARGRNSAEK